MIAMVEKAGILDTVQDSGRQGWGHLGINPNGPMDWFSHELANALVGNSVNTAVIELHFPASTIRFLQPAIIALAGADFGASINNVAVPVNRTVKVPAGGRLHFSRKIKGERAYLAIRHGWHFPSTLGSCSTNLRSKFGGNAGRKLMPGDNLPYSTPGDFNISHVQVSNSFATAAPASGLIRVLPGPEWNWLDESSQAAIASNAFTLNLHSDRMAFSWRSEPLQLLEKREMISSAVTFGTVQLLPNGQVLTLMADHQTVGGYPRILQVIKADLPGMAQLSPGSVIRFQLCNVETALREWQQMKSHLQQIATNVRLQMAFG